LRKSSRTPSQIFLSVPNAGLMLAVDTNDYNVDDLHHDTNARFAARHA
jgi:hypothetical protein